MFNYKLIKKKSKSNKWTLNSIDESFSSNKLKICNNIIND